MRRRFSFLLGALSGGAAAAALLYVNPLTGAAGTRVDGSDWTFAYAYPERSSLALTHKGFGLLPLVPADVPRLWESTIRGTAVNVLLLERASGDTAAAAATRISVPSAASGPLRHGAIISDYWLVSVPGRGSFFAHDENNVWPLIKDALLPVVLLKREWPGPSTYMPTVGPSRAGLGAVHGATGEFAGLGGRAAERYRLERLAGDGRIESLAGELAVRFSDPEAALPPQ